MFKLIVRGFAACLQPLALKVVHLGLPNLTKLDVPKVLRPSCENAPRAAYPAGPLHAGHAGEVGGGVVRESRQAAAQNFKARLGSFGSQPAQQGNSLRNGSGRAVGLVEQRHLRTCFLPAGRVADGHLRVKAVVTLPESLLHGTLAANVDFDELGDVRLAPANLICASAFRCLRFDATTRALALAQREAGSGNSFKKANVSLVAGVAKWQTHRT
jgi:hypothetical protein